MLQKTENVAKNVANKKSQDLTEQYKHGNLPDDRLYYYRFKGEPEVQITTQYGLYCEEADNKKEIEVIDFVPSYEEYDKLWQSNKEVANRNIDLIIKLNTLKELLKECKDLIELMQAISGIKQIKFTVIDDFVKKINEVLDA